MEPRGHRASLVLTGALIAWVVFMVAGAAAFVLGYSGLALASWTSNVTIIVYAIVSRTVFAERDIQFSVAAPTVRRQRVEIETRPAPQLEAGHDLPFSEDEYVQIRKRVPFVGLVRSGYSDTSEAMSDNPAPPSGSGGPVTISGVAAALAVERAADRRRQKA